MSDICNQCIGVHLPNDEMCDWCNSFDKFDNGMEEYRDKVKDLELRILELKEVITTMKLNHESEISALNYRIFKLKENDFKNS